MKAAEALRRHSSFFLAAGLFLAAASPLLAVETLTDVQLVLLASAVLLLGLPHGAMDLFIARQAGLWTGWRTFISFHLIYLAIAGLTVLGFLLAPVPALALFLLASIWHFSDDWPGLPRTIRLAGACAIVVLPVISDPIGVGLLFRSITSTNAPLPEQVPYPLLLMSIWIVAGAILIAARHDRRAAFEIATVSMLAIFLPALLFFASYFVLLHSPRHLLRNANSMAGVSPRVILFGYTAISILIVALLTITMPTSKPEVSDLVLRGLFIGLAALTTPHMILLEYRGKLVFGARSGASCSAIE